MVVSFSQEVEEVRLQSAQGADLAASSAAEAHPIAASSEPRQSLGQSDQGSESAAPGARPAGEATVTPALRSGLVHALSAAHASEDGKHIERPERVAASIKSLDSEGLLARFVQLPCREASCEDLSLVHTEEHLEAMEAAEAFDTHELSEAASAYDSVYLTSDSPACARAAAGGVVDLTRRVVSGEIQNGLAVVRPPGHHAEDGQCCGFCIYNAVAIAAAVAKREPGVERVLIVDWDVHHGNGTQHMFENDSSVLYFSVHRYDNGEFFPGSTDAAPQVVGQGAGRGFTVNVAWNLQWKDHVGMGDDDYLAAWQLALLPIAQEFKPDVVLVSAGFDAAAGDLGGCSVTPAGFAQLTRMLQVFVCPRIVMVLEGGYDVGVLSKCICACAHALLGDDIAERSSVRPKSQARHSLERTLRAHRPFWRSLRGSGIPERAQAARVAITTTGAIVVDAGPKMLSSEQTDDAAETEVPARKVPLTALQEAAPARAARLGKKKTKEKPVTGMAISTRNAATANWKGDVKKLQRRQAELNEMLGNIEDWKRSAEGGAKMNRKSCTLIGEEEEFRWELQEAEAELQELTSLTQVDAVRMYTGGGAVKPGARTHASAGAPCTRRRGERGQD